MQMRSSGHGGDEAQQVCVVIVNYQTPDLLEDTVRSFKSFYPDVHTVIVDNGSQDTSPEVIRRLCEEYHAIEAAYRSENAGHGPAMHGIIAKDQFEYYFLLDSDTVTKRGGFLEKMFQEYSDDRVYGVGKVLPYNKRGFEDASGVPMLVAAYMLIKSSHYQNLSPFEHHGAPVARNFYEAWQKGLLMKDFPIDDYIDHLHRGTVARFGYGLGLKGKINYLLNKLGL